MSKLLNIYCLPWTFSYYSTQLSHQLLLLLLLLCSHVCLLIIVPITKSNKTMIQWGKLISLLSLFGIRNRVYLSHFIPNSEAPHTCPLSHALDQHLDQRAWVYPWSFIAISSHEETAHDIREMTDFFSLTVTLYRSFNQILWVSNFWPLKLGGGKEWFLCFSL